MKTTGRHSLVAMWRTLGFNIMTSFDRPVKLWITRYLHRYQSECFVIISTLMITELMFNVQHFWTCRICIFSVVMYWYTSSYRVASWSPSRDLHKEGTPPEIYRSRFYEICAHGFHRLYTDVSKVGDQVALAAVNRNSTKVVRLANKASIFRAELYAITLAMDFIRRSKDTKFIVFSNSMWSLQALNGFKIEVDLVLIKVSHFYRAAWNATRS